MRADLRIPKRFSFGGGLDLITPHPMLKPGTAVLGTRNYEVPLGGGHRRVDGYERFDGRAPKPSDATYERIPFNNGGNRVIQPYDIITGAISGATAVVVATPTLTAGTWPAGNGVGELSYTMLTGFFFAGENLLITGVANCTTTDVASPGTIGDADYKACARGAQTLYRSLIQKLPGSGAVRGVWVYKGDVFGIRDNAGATAAVLHKATVAGWTPVALGSYLRYQNAGATVSTGIAEGDVITGGTSGATAIVQRVNIASGTFTGPSFATGRLAITAIGGVFQNGENLLVGGTVRAVAVGTQTANAFLPGGRFEFDNFNFFGASNRFRMYGVDGVNRAFEFDGTVFCFIESGMAVDTPNHLAVHKLQLFLGFPGGSLQNSGIGQPLVWSPRTGAGEIGLGDDITALYSIKQDTLGVFARNSVALLYGSSNANWVLQKHAGRIGSLPYSVQEIDGQVTFLDNRGLFDMANADSFGDFEDVALSRKVKTLIISKAINLKASVLCREKSQIRLFFGDKTALTATFNGGVVEGWLPQQYAHQFVCSVSGEDVNGNEIIFAGGDDGYVYQLNRGGSFDGEKIESLLVNPFYDYGAPETEKQFVKFKLHTDCPRAVSLSLIIDFDYGGQQIGNYPDLSVTPTGGAWDAANWNEFFWDGVVVSTPEAQIDGWGLNMQPSIYHNDDIDPPFNLQAATTLYIANGMRI
jgi:hypothetical protein